MIFKLRNIANHQATAVPPGQHAVGRDEVNYIQLEDGTVSRQHAMLFNTGEGFFVEDLDSANGTVVRGQLVQGRTQVVFGDVIYFGEVPCKIEPEVDVPGEAPPPGTGLKPLNANRQVFRKATEKLPVARIRLDKASAVANEPPPPEPPAPTPVATPAAVAAVAKERPHQQPIPVPTPDAQRKPQTTRTSGSGEKVRYVVSVPVAVWLALFAGFGLGLLAGVLLFRLL